MRAPSVRQARRRPPGERRCPPRSAERRQTHQDRRVLERRQSRRSRRRYLVQARPRRQRGAVRQRSFDTSRRWAAARPRSDSPPLVLRQCARARRFPVSSPRGGRPPAAIPFAPPVALTTRRRGGGRSRPPSQATHAGRGAAAARSRATRRYLAGCGRSSPAERARSPDPRVSEW